MFRTSPTQAVRVPPPTLPIADCNHRGQHQPWHVPSLSLCHLFFFFHFLLACSLAQGVGVLRSRQPASLFRALVDESGSRAHFDRATTACVSSPRDWAVSVGSHMQQDMGISQAPPHPRAPFPWFDAVHFRKPRSPKLAIILPPR